MKKRLALSFLSLLSLGISSNLYSATDGTGIVEIYQTPGLSGDLQAISTRGYADAGNPLIAGIYIGNATASTSATVRARGPSINLPSGKLSDPVLSVYDQSGKLLDSNDNWQTHPTAEKVKNAGHAPGDAREAALSYTFPPGLYTVVVKGVTTADKGTAIVEVYQTPNMQGDMQAISTRGYVTQANPLIAGVIVGSGAAATQATVRGRGPSMNLPSGKLENPFLQL